MFTIILNKLKPPKLKGFKKYMHENKLYQRKLMFEYIYVNKLIKMN
jgi:hypothetical protein